MIGPQRQYLILTYRSKKASLTFTETRGEEEVPVEEEGFIKEGANLMTFQCS